MTVLTSQSQQESSECQDSAWHQDEIDWRDVQAILWLEHRAGGGDLQSRDKGTAKTQDLQGEVMAGAACGSHPG